MKRILAILATVAMAQSAAAQEAVTYDTDQSFEDVIFGLESAILDRGLVIDSVSHVGDMLNRTQADVGGTKAIFEKADVYSFCSAQLSREVMEADPMNVIFCPYDVFVLVHPDRPETTTIGFRAFPEGAMQTIHDLLDGIALEAIGRD